MGARTYFAHRRCITGPELNTTTSSHNKRAQFGLTVKAEPWEFVGATTELLDGLNR